MSTESPQPGGLVAGRRRVIVLVAGVALLSLVLGMVLAGRVMSPEEAASRTDPPEASYVTAPVERRVVQSQVVTRGDFVYEDALDVTIETGSLTTNPVVTGQIPRVGDQIEAGTVLLQVAGRPVITLPGDIPAYRDLRPGLAGLDVVQLKQALVALGLNPGDPRSDRYDHLTAAAVAQLYERVGYAPPEPEEESVEELDAAQEDVTTAEEELAAAQQELASAATPPSPSEKLQADAEVAAAHQVLAEARASGDPNAIADAEMQVVIAETQRAELLAPRSTTFEQGAVNRAQARLSQAESEVAELEASMGTALPAAEVVFVSRLPRRVDRVLVARGQAIGGPVLRLSGADLVVVATIGSADGELVRTGMQAQMELGETTIRGSVADVRPARNPDQTAAGDGGDGGEQTGESGEGGEGGGDGGTGAPASGRLEAVITPATLTPEQVERARGQNVRVTIPVEATRGEVLAVPVAAVSATADGMSRVQVERADGSTERVPVDVGLTAGGFAEIRPRDESLGEGDRVVVGR